MLCSVVFASHSSTPRKGISFLSKSVFKFFNLFLLYLKRREDRGRKWSSICCLLLRCTQQHLGSNSVSHVEGSDPSVACILLSRTSVDPELQPRHSNMGCKLFSSASAMTSNFSSLQQQQQKAKNTYFYLFKSRRRISFLQRLVWIRFLLLSTKLSPGIGFWYCPWMHKASAKIHLRKVFFRLCMDG